MNSNLIILPPAFFLTSYTEVREVDFRNQSKKPRDNIFEGI